MILALCFSLSVQAGDIFGVSLVRTDQKEINELSRQSQGVSLDWFRLPMKFSLNYMTSELRSTAGEFVLRESRERFSLSASHLWGSAGEDVAAIGLGMDLGTQRSRVLMNVSEVFNSQSTSRWAPVIAPRFDVLLGFRRKWGLVLGLQIAQEILPEANWQNQLRSGFSLTLLSQP